MHYIKFDRGQIMRMRGLVGGVLTLGILWVGVAQAYTPQEEANIKLVRDFYNSLEAPRVEGAARGNISDYIAADYIQHSTVNGPGGPGGQRRGAGAPPSAGGPPSGGAPPNAGGPPGAGAPPRGAGPSRMGPSTLLSITADGDKVIQVTSRNITDSSGKVNETFIFNMFRVKDGKLVEHWDAFSPEPK
jgi:predicted SnoaL-like aldol condensation-catalyzing enzyme